MHTKVRGLAQGHTAPEPLSLRPTWKGRPDRLWFQGGSAEGHRKSASQPLFGLRWKRDAGFELGLKCLAGDQQEEEEGEGGWCGQVGGVERRLECAQEGYAGQGPHMHFPWHPAATPERCHVPQ